MILSVLELVQKPCQNKSLNTIICTLAINICRVHFLPENLGLEPLTTGYVALLWKQKDYEVYKNGKYHTAEDKILFAKEKRNTQVVAVKRFVSPILIK